LHELRLFGRGKRRCDREGAAQKKREGLGEHGEAQREDERLVACNASRN
jgi:hypothetical protein